MTFSKHLCCHKLETKGLIDTKVTRRKSKFSREICSVTLKLSPKREISITIETH